MAASRVPDFPGPQRVARSRTPLNADTSSQPSGITRRVMLNILEAFFRHPVLHLLPLVLMLLLGAVTSLTGSNEYRSVGALSVTNESLLADLTDAANTPGVTFESPATVRSRQINELLGTNEFLDDVIASAGLQATIEQGILTADDVRSAVGASADGDSIVRVTATSGNPELSMRIARGTIDSFEAWVIDSYVSQSTSTERSLEQRVAEKESAANAADQALRDFVNLQPDTAVLDRSAADQLEYDRLKAAADRAEDQLVAAQDALDQARTTTAESPAIVAQRLRVVDEPEQPGAAEGRLRKAILTMAVFGVVGLILSIASVLVSATLDRTIRVPNDISARFGLDVLAVVPDVRR